jgi:hypothetical protein
VALPRIHADDDEEQTLLRTVRQGAPDSERTDLIPSVDEACADAETTASMVGAPPEAPPRAAAATCTAADAPAAPALPFVKNDDPSLEAVRRFREIGADSVKPPVRRRQFDR